MLNYLLWFDILFLQESVLFCVSCEPANWRYLSQGCTLYSHALSCVCQLAETSQVLKSCVKYEMVTILSDILPNDGNKEKQLSNMS